MKANRKFLNNEDEAVSPVIAVILMVAITVVLAATVYVWVSGFGSSSNSSPAHTMSLVSAGAITFSDEVQAADDYWYKTYTVSSADPSLTYGDIKITVGGTEHSIATADPLCNGGANDYDGPTGNAWFACGGTTERTAASSVTAGDRFVLLCHDTAANCLVDKDFLILDTEANSVMVTLKVR